MLRTVMIDIWPDMLMRRDLPGTVDPSHLPLRAGMNRACGLQKQCGCWLIMTRRTQYQGLSLYKKVPTIRFLRASHRGLVPVKPPT